MIGSVRIRAGVGAALLAVLIGGCTSDDAEPRAATTSSVAAFGQAGEWTALPPSPLSARHEVDGVWVADRFVVVGGLSSPPCPAAASCLAPADPPLRDGASFDPATGQWTRIADAPVPLSAWNPVTLGDRLYVLANQYLQRPDSPATFLSYDPDQDVWATHPLPPGDGDLVAAGSVVALVSGSDESGPAHDYAFDPEGNAWHKLPDDPLGPSFGRSAIWVNDSLLLAANDLVSNPGSERPSLVRIARLNADLTRWSILPRSEILGNTLVSVAGRAVWADPGSEDGGDVGGWGRSYPAGGMFDPATNTWHALPATSPAPGEPCCSGTVVGQNVLIGNRLLDPVAGRSLPVPALPGERRTAAAVLGSPTALLVWGGAVENPTSFPGSENVATGYLWRPPTATAATWTPAPTMPTELNCSAGGRDATSRPDLIGRRIADVRRDEQAAGHTIRIVGTDGSCRGQTADLRRYRVDLYTENGLVVWAQMY